ncbi:hypothetical protein [Halomonas sp. BM-2019]|uniref:hypothetical protein n=1 Tax=Halomonas sp. BM-2019 TaxID=2811227 RepID=UPI001B3C1C48|nr:MAG: hypothetical protein J5F18_14830 [Halomonas sp. BM-2019]
MTDSQAVVTANALLGEADATVEALRDALQAIDAEMREMDKLPRIDLSTALSVTQHKQMEEEKRGRELQYEILRRLSFGLNDGIRKRRAADAIAGADEDRDQLDRLIEMARHARQVANEAVAEAVAHARTIVESRQAAGRPGSRLVGATPEQADALVSLMPNESQHDDVERVRMHRLVQVEGGQ